jgi:hypothetical protein
MRKFTLDLNAVEVQSFVTDEAATRLFGTVHAHHTNEEEGRPSEACGSRKFADCSGRACTGKSCSDKPCK